MMANTLHQHAGSHGEFHRVVALNSLYARKLGPVKAIWLCQAAYTQTKVGPGRWWFKKLLADQDENGQMIPPEREIDHSFEYETGLNRTQQESARKTAVQLGVLEERRSGYQGRLEYLIDLDALARLVSKWVEDERNIARSGKQEITFLKEESIGLESENLHSSTKSIQIKKSRTAPADTAVRNSNGVPMRQHAQRRGFKGRSKFFVEGVECWTDSDEEQANFLLEKHGKDKIRGAVSKLQDEKIRPLPSEVRKVLSRPVGPDMVEQTSILLSKYSADKDERTERTAARKAAEQLPASERRDYVMRFIEKNGPNYTSSFNFSTDKFANPAENIQFKRWQENQIIQIMLSQLGRAHTSNFDSRCTTTLPIFNYQGEVDGVAAKDHIY